MTGESFQLRLGGSGVGLELVGRRRRARFDVPVYDGDGEVVGSQVVTVHSGGGLSPGARRMTERSRWSMLRAVNGLPWERLSRPVLITLTYPGTWRQYVKDDREWGKHRDLLSKRWEYQWGEPVVCFWVKEFQVRGAPHIHMVASLPAAVSDKDYEGLRVRTKRLFGEYQVFGKRVAGERWRAVDGKFGWWLRRAWAEVVTGNVRGDGAARKHHARGVTLRVRFDHGEGELENRVRMAEYLWRDLGKAHQKQAPEDFGGVRQWWGYRGPGFKPEETVLSVPWAVGWRVRRRMVRWVAVQIGGARGWDAAREYREKVERYPGGVQARGLGHEAALRFLRWSLAAERRRVEGRGEDAASGASSAEPLDVIDLQTGEVVTGL